MGQDFAGVSEMPLWLQIWEMKMAHIVVFAVFLLSILLVMVFKDRLAKREALLRIIRYAILLFSFVYVGLILRAQPTTTNIIILFNSLRHFQFPIELFLLEPFLFLSFSFILLTLLLWGRGVFCGWLCPYGAMLELLFKGFQRFFPHARWHLPDGIHRRLIDLKYLVFIIIMGASLYSFILSEYLVEVEPFRTFVLKLNREWYFIVYFIILSLGSVTVYRAFCRYICPLGAALALPALVKWVPLVKMKRYDFCRSCKICARTCRPRAVMADGPIDSRECMTCLDCQINFWDEDLCPVLIKEKKTESGS